MKKYMHEVSYLMAVYCLMAGYTFSAVNSDK